MNENAKPIASSIEETKPELVVLIDRLIDAVDRNERLTYEIGVKIDNISRYSEPLPKCVPPLDEKLDTFVNKFAHTLHMIEDNNNKLEFNLIHLGNII